MTTNNRSILTQGVLVFPFLFCFTLAHAAELISGPVEK